MVDVGGGIGSVSMAIAKAAPHVQIVVQDRPAVVEDASKVPLEYFAFLSSMLKQQ